MTLLLGCASAQTSSPGAEVPGASAPSSSAVAPSSDGSAPAPAGTASTPKPSAATATSAPTSSAPVPASLRFDGTTIDGQEFEGSTLQGRPVVLWFWAPWCPTCRSQLPEVNEIAATYQGRVQVVAVGSLDSAESISRFADDIADDAVQLSDAQGTIWKHFKVTEQSSYVVLDGTGAETFRSGYGGSADLADEVAAVAS